MWHLSHILCWKSEMEVSDAIINSLKVLASDLDYNSSICESALPILNSDYRETICCQLSSTLFSASTWLKSFVTQPVQHRPFRFHRSAAMFTRTAALNSFAFFRSSLFCAAITRQWRAVVDVDTSVRFSSPDFLDVTMLLLPCFRDPQKNSHHDAEELCYNFALAVIR